MRKWLTVVAATLAVSCGCSNPEAPSHSDPEIPASLAGVWRPVEAQWGRFFDTTGLHIDSTMFYDPNYSVSFDSLLVGSDGRFSRFVTALDDCSSYYIDVRTMGTVAVTNDSMFVLQSDSVSYSPNLWWVDPPVVQPSAANADVAVHGTLRHDTILIPYGDRMAQSRDSMPYIVEHAGGLPDTIYPGEWLPYWWRGP
jgi:hypothetical protein